MKLIINADVEKNQINRNIYGHFSEHLGRCIYGGIYVGEDSEIPNIHGMRTDVVEALKKIKVPVLRWPGGCFADDYHWEDGIGPKADRPTMVNTHWGGVTEDNSFGTHEFLEFCKLIDAEPYINGNVGSGTVREMRDWVEYMTFDGVSPMADKRRENGQDEPWKIGFFGVGNEAWGCGGNMRPEYYADEFRKYATYLKNYSDNKLFRIASGASDGDYYWTKVMMERIGHHMQGLAVHHYSTAGPNFNIKGDALEFTEEEWFGSMASSWKMEEFIQGHAAIMDEYDPEKKIALIVDEWGNWYEVEKGTNPGFLYQQNSVRDAVVAGLILNMFNQHSDRIKMANIAQMVNVLQSVILTEGDKMVLTPTYHIFDMYKDHQDAMLLASAELDVPQYTLNGKSLTAVNSTASKAADGSVLITLANIDPSNAQNVVIDVRGMNVASVEATVLTGPEMNSYNSFEEGNVVAPAAFDGYTLDGSVLNLTLPAKAVVALKVR